MHLHSCPFLRLDARKKNPLNINAAQPKPIIESLKW